jgi:hypothetical protein
MRVIYSFFWKIPHPCSLFLQGLRPFFAVFAAVKPYKAPASTAGAPASIVAFLGAAGAAAAQAGKAPTPNLTKPECAIMRI